jgi:hypothetical protein
LLRKHRKTLYLFPEKISRAAFSLLNIPDFRYPVKSDESNGVAQANGQAGCNGIAH